MEEVEKTENNDEELLSELKERYLGSDKTDKTLVLDKMKDKNETLLLDEKKEDKKESSNLKSTFEYFILQKKLSKMKDDLENYLNILKRKLNLA